jgi:hypothetical protein
MRDKFEHTKQTVDHAVAKKVWVDRGTGVFLREGSPGFRSADGGKADVMHEYQAVQSGFRPAETH